jgi:hypothetical protein
VARRRAPTGPSLPTIKRLFVHSGNRCAFPRCTATLIDGGTVVGKVCHIKGAKPGSARYDAQQSAAKRHGFDNLILMCGRHHDVIDADEEAYTVDRLLKMKADHKSRAAVSIDDDFAERAAHLLINQSVISLNQSGGIIAHTINLHSTDTSQLLFERRYAIYNCAQELIKLLDNEAYKDEFEPTSISPYLRTLDDVHLFFPDHISNFLRVLQHDCEHLALAYGDIKHTKHAPERALLGKAIGDLTARLHKLSLQMPALFAEVLQFPHLSK